MKTKCLRLCSVLVIIALLISSIKFTGNLLEDKTSDKRFASFFTEEQNIDVIFIGSSHVKYGIFPMELWGKYGITSYNLASDGSTIPVSYWTLVNALDYQRPEVVVMDVYDIWPGRVCSVNWGQVEAQFDAFPFSINKAKMVVDLFDDKELTDDSGNNLYERRWDLLFNINAYHTRWNSLKEEDFILEDVNDANSRIWKGAAPLANILVRIPTDYSNLDVSAVEYDDLSKEYLIRIIELCRDEDIDLVLINTGYDCGGDSKVFHDSVIEVSANYGISYIDFTTNPIINFETDLHNSGNNTHVNFSGAERLSSYIGEYLNKNFNLMDHRQDGNYNEWSDDYLKYVHSKDEYLIKQSELMYYMEFLNNPDYVVIIQMLDETVLNDNMIAALMKNLGVSLETHADIYIADIDNYDVQYINIGQENEWKTKIGTLSLIRLDNECAFNLENKELYTYIYSEDTSKIKFSVYSKEQQCIIDVRSF